ncbi:hypothetical protein L6R49_04820 [Myxococcota bacterium]|nr:hypothetical protein [Myxococcota bacterium]
MSWIDDVADEPELVVSWMHREREEGRREGRQEAWQEGWQEGWQEAARDLLRRLLLQRFGPLRAEHDLALAEASAERLDRWVDLIFTAPTAEAFFAAPPDDEGGA